MSAVAVTKNNLKVLLEEREMSGYELAKRWGKATNYVYGLINRDNLDSTDAAILVEASKLLDCSIEQIVCPCNGQ